ncbi:Hypothetical predicted protein [Octopus vulgaris]|uniref:Uncharacterized protein n=1 Tax=Octopus vulgaris TaxID=6645 RepID=A0AA36AS95_OCTVU|nr:Hypothetical predicted protein [Octopus vulgaris]
MIPQNYKYRAIRIVSVLKQWHMIDKFLVHRRVISNEDECCIRHYPIHRKRKLALNSKLFLLPYQQTEL